MIRHGAIAGLLAVTLLAASPLAASPDPAENDGLVADPPTAMAPTMEPETERPGLLVAPTLTIEPIGFAAEILEALETTDPLASGNAGEPIAAAVRQFYSDRAYRPIWTDGKAPLDRAKSLLAAVLAAAEDGLEPSDYITPAVQALFEAKDEKGLAQLEASLTWAFVGLASDLASGRTVPNEVDPELFVHPHNINPAVLLSQASVVHDIKGLVAKHAPQTDAYRNLKSALKRYRAIERLGGWTPMSGGRILRPGYRGPRVRELKGILAERGEDIHSEDDRYDAELTAVVRAFQRRHGLSPDGAWGPKALAALNMPVSERIKQITINMERWRWMPDHLGDRYAFVNMANFTLEIVYDDELVYETRVVIGTDADRTPVFSDRMTYLVVNPFWNIPPSIARDEMLPQLRADPYSLERKGIRVFSSWSASAREVDPGTVDWYGVTGKTTRYKFRQDSGGRNALGRVKFMFPNKFNIYLHDTPSKSLFRRTVRTFSHGCIRVEEPFRLAKLLLKDDQRWTEDRFDAQLASGQRRIVSLPQPVNVHLTYLTSWVDREGVVQFRDDVYGRDKRLTMALDASRQSPAMVSASRTN
ncbi:MAG: L,D-transpeptidase family protein [Alphaproteobacteria bacterium]